MSHTTTLRATVVACVALGLLLPGVVNAQEAEARAAHSASSLDARATASQPVPSLIRALLRRARQPVVNWVKRRIRGEALQWTRDELIELYCDSWYRYFGYDFRYWYRAAWVDWRANWAWRYCASHGYSG